MPDYLHSAPAAWSQSRADVQPHGCVATNALLVFARVYWSAPAAAASRPLHINYLHIIVHKWAASERGRWKGGGKWEGGTLSMWNLARGLVYGALQRLFACKLFEQCCWAAVTAAASRSGLKNCQHTAESTGGCLTPWMANGSIAPLHLKMWM